MPNVQCHKCNKIFAKKFYLERHLNKKNPCQQLVLLPPNTTVLPLNTIKTFQNVSKLPSNTTKMLQTATNSQLNATTILPVIIHPEIPKPINKYQCNYCNKSFVRKDVANKHMKSSCNVLKQQNNDKQEIFDNEKIKKLEEEIKNLKSATINNNTVNVINIVPHGEEDLAKSKVDELLLILSTKKGFNAVPELIMRVHFSSRFPEFQNVYIPDIKNKYAMVYDTKWDLKNIEDVISNLYETKSEFITENKDIFYKHLNPGEKIVYERWAKCNMNRDSEDFKLYITNTREQIKLLLFNNRDMVIATKKLNK